MKSNTEVCFTAENGYLAVISKVHEKGSEEDDD